jgi:hypothetical protein
MGDDQFFWMLFMSISRSELDNAIDLHNRTKASLLLWFSCLTAGVTGGGADMDNVRKQRKLEARKRLENVAESPPSSARFVGCAHALRLLLV